MKSNHSKNILYTVIMIVVILVMEWGSTKKAVSDAWNGVYCPPVEQVE